MNAGGESGADLETGLGLDLGWFAVDRDGHVGFFTTAGCGLLPPQALKADYLSSDLEDYLRHTDPITEALPDAELPVDAAQVWTAVAQRGLYAYDWPEAFHGTWLGEGSHSLGPYRRVARPEVPIHALGLPEKYRSHAERIQLGAICFEDAPRLSPERYLECVR